MLPGSVDVEVATGDRGATAAAGILAGALVGRVAVGTVSAPGVTLLFTDKGRVVVVCERGDGDVARLEGRSPREVQLHVVGSSPHTWDGSPMIVVDVVGPDGIPLRVRLHAAALQPIAQWMSMSA